MHDEDQSVTNLEFEALMDRAYETNRAPPMHLVRHTSGCGQLGLPLKNDFMDLRKSSEPIPYSQFGDDVVNHKTFGGSQPSILATTPRKSDDEEVKSSNIDRRPVQTPNAVLAYKMRQSGYVYDSNVRSERFTQSYVVESQPIQVWKEDFAMNYGAMSVVHPMQTLGQPQGASEFKIHCAEVKNTDRPSLVELKEHTNHFDGMKLASPIVEKETSSILSSKSKKIKKIKSVKIVADKSNRK